MSLNKYLIIILDRNSLFIFVSLVGNTLKHCDNRKIFIKLNEVCFPVDVLEKDIKILSIVN